MIEAWSLCLQFRWDSVGLNVPVQGDCITLANSDVREFAWVVTAAAGTAITRAKLTGKTGWMPALALINFAIDASLKMFRAKALARRALAFDPAFLVGFVTGASPTARGITPRRTFILGTCVLAGRSSPT